MGFLKIDNFMFLTTRGFLLCDKLVTFNWFHLSDFELFLVNLSSINVVFYDIFKP